MGIQIGIVTRSRTWVTGALAVLFVLCWSSGFIGAKLGAADAPVTTVLMWRFVPLALALLPFLLAQVRQSAAHRRIPGLGRHVLIGILSQSVYLLTVYWAIELGVGTGTTALIDGVQPLVAAALVGPLLGVAVTGRQWAGLALGLVGVVLVIWSDAASAGQAPAWAYLVPFLGMLGLVASTIVERRAPAPMPPLRALAIHCSTSAVVFTGLAIATGTAVPPASGSFWLALAWLLVFATFGGYGLYWLLVERIGVTPVNGLMFLIAPVTSVWGGVMFDEPFTPLTAVGLALALVAALVAGMVRDGTRPPKGERDAQPAGRRLRI
ncbi:DMT family transporter [Marinactinospora thermotolerans]|uniref:Permease of the drug/metabolite transporter (DMT) superfamily n=1 Tax=Marinactinospora thermotolerans DSM 45154 TaxID=1122192 RepID=A0A1T4N3Z8_9ACTN|nr:DMT family transporter [Marinactinospora thermotolerans]SJZ73864.1 Permease of the drug/metabolite transporter (DMT) superfamily [Marinactinospora thermotolerans DSM 45154]